MPNAAVVAAALTDHSSRRYGLFLGGLDVIKQPGATGSGYGVPLETVEIREAAPGQVSSMTFTIDDPQNVISLTSGVTVRLIDFTADVIEFTGFLDTAELDPYAASRSIHVSCIGIEAVLDWMVLASDVVLASNTPAQDAAQILVTACIGIGMPLNTAAGTASNYDVPIGIQLANAQYAYTVTAGTTLRQALQAVGDAGIAPYNGAGPAMISATVDFYGGLWFGLTATDLGGTRVTQWFQSLVLAGAPITVSNAGPKVPADPAYTPLAGGGVRQVLVKGTGVTVTVTDGTGLPGQTAVLVDANIVTATDAATKARAYMAQNGTGASGSFTLQITSQVNGRDNALRAFSPLIYTDPLLGLSSTPLLVSSITKKFYGNGTQDWTIAYGARSMMGTMRIRSLTNAVIR